MPNRTPLYDAHVALGARIVDFAGWTMPIDYGSQIAEHQTVREAAGMFDVSHMAVVDITGNESRAFLARVLANDIARADDIGKAIYSCLLNTRGGVIDDLIVYHLGDDFYRAVVNAATADKDLGWLHSQARDFDVDVTQREDLAIIAVQGPQAREIAGDVLASESVGLGDLAERAAKLKPFQAAVDGDKSIGRTGYTGEDGYEIVLPAADAPGLWNALHDAGVAPVGLGARDTLRLEAGLNLYGQDMDEDRTPLESGLAWTVAFEPEDREFIGREALEYARNEGTTHKLVGLVLKGRGVIRSHAAVRAADSHVEADEAEGEITSGSYGPTLSRSIALARVPQGWQDAVEVQIRNNWQAARIVAYPFVRNGKSRIDD